MSPSSRFDAFRVGQTASFERRVRASDVHRFVELTGDDNPVHVDDEFARAIGVGGRVVHGLLTASYVSTAIGTVLPGPGALLLSERFNFRAPVRVDDRIEVGLTVRHVSPATRILVLDVKVTNQHDNVVLDGEAHVQVLENASEMNESTQGARTAVVTGSGRGIGAAIAQRLASDGLRVVLNFRSDERQATETLQSIRRDDGEASLFRADVTDREQARALVEFAAATYGAVDVLVNNAGGPIDRRPLSDTRWEDVEQHLTAQLQGSVHCVEAALPDMVEREFGRIVNVTSQAAYGVPPPKSVGYVVAKAALAAFTRCIAVEGGLHGITANAVAPGMTETDMIADVPQRARMVLAAQAPLRRLGRTNDVADAVSFLVGPGAASVTGQTLHLSGGLAMT